MVHHSDGQGEGEANDGGSEKHSPGHVETPSPSDLLIDRMGDGPGAWGATSPALVAERWRGIRVIAEDSLERGAALRARVEALSELGVEVLAMIPAEEMRHAWHEAALLSTAAQMRSIEMPVTAGLTRADDLFLFGPGTRGWEEDGVQAEHFQGADPQEMARAWRDLAVMDPARAWVALTHLPRPLFAMLDREDLAVLLRTRNTYLRSQVIGAMGRLFPPGPPE